MVSSDALALIWIIRDAKEITVEDLKKKLAAGIPDAPEGVQGFLREFEHIERFPTIRNMFKMLIRGLVQDGLVSADNPQNPEANGTVLRLSDHVEQFLTGMGISLSEMLAKDGYRMQVFPFFGSPSKKIEATDVFVAMPFRDDLRGVYDVAVLAATQEVGLTCRRGDDFKGSRHIMEEVWSSIVRCRICVVDCTGNNANVFYELGIADTLGREVVLIAQNISEVPFDLSHRRCVGYENSPRGLVELKNVLVKQFRELGKV